MIEIIFEAIIKLTINFFKKIFGIKKDKVSKTIKREYYEKPLMTEYEYNFFKKIEPLEKKYNIRIIPQLNLATIIKKVSTERYQSELYRNIDFAIFSSDLKKLLLLIEVNDKTHNNRNRKNRDFKVQKIIENAGLELMTFYTTYDNNVNYVQSRIMKSIIKDGNTLPINENNFLNNGSSNDWFTFSYNLFWWT